MPAILGFATLKAAGHRQEDKLRNCILQPTTPSIPRTATNSTQHSAQMHCRCMIAPELDLQHQCCSQHILKCLFPKRSKAFALHRYCAAAEHRAPLPVRCIKQRIPHVDEKQQTHEVLWVHFAYATTVCNIHIKHPPFGLRSREKQLFEAARRAVVLATVERPGTTDYARRAVHGHFTCLDSTATKTGLAM